MGPTILLAEYEPQEQMAESLLSEVDRFAKGREGETKVTTMKRAAKKKNIAFTRAAENLRDTGQGEPTQQGAAREVAEGGSYRQASCPRQS